MFDLIIRGALVVDPLNKINAIKDVAVAEGKITAIEDEISLPAKKLIEASGKVLIPGIIDMHTHMRTVLGHKHAQRMIALAGVCTTLDMAGPLEDILTSIPGSGAGVNIAILDAARAGQTLTSSRPSQQEQSDFLDRTLENGGIGIKLLGGHFPMDVDISESFIELANQKNPGLLGTSVALPTARISKASEKLLLRQRITSCILLTSIVTAAAKSPMKPMKPLKRFLFSRLIRISSQNLIFLH